jgi:hypothetical protein
MNDVAQSAYKQMIRIPRDKDENPLSFEDVIRSMILKNPDMIQWRDDALNMMYCTLGSGIDWNEAGRLADRSPNNYMNLPPEAEDRSMWSDDYGMSDTLDKLECAEEIRRRLKQQHDKRLKKAEDTILDINIRCNEYRPKRSYWYPLSWYSPNLAAPANAQEDFFLGAIETATLISSSDFECTLGFRWRDSIRTKEVASEILVILKDRQTARTKNE